MIERRGVMRESQEGLALALALAHQLSGLDPSSAPALALIHVGRYLGRQLSLLSGHSPLPLHLLPLFVVRRTVDDVSHDVDMSLSGIILVKGLI